jgi:hypothetical protein
MEFMVCNGSINKGIKRVYGSVTVVHLRHTLVRRIWTAWIFLYSSCMLFYLKYSVVVTSIYGPV